MGGMKGARCPKAGCNYHVEANSAKDAIQGLREHMMEEHGEEMPEEIGEAISGDIKARKESRS
jgi:predicted small metal-binding protein